MKGNNLKEYEQIDMMASQPRSSIWTRWSDWEYRNRNQNETNSTSHKSNL